MLRLIPLGGLGEIGMNALVLETGDERLLLDCGLQFPKAQELGVDVILPDFSPLFEGEAKLTGVVLTHAHEDHLGALPWLLREAQVPVFGTPFTLAVARAKLDEAELAADLRTIFPRESVSFGDFQFEALQVTHSVPDAIGLYVKTASTSLIHTGDFKLDPFPTDGKETDVQRLAQLAETGIDFLLSDSTNAEVPGRTPSERLVAQSFETLFAEKHNRIVVALFGSHLHRVQHLLRLAQKIGRKVLLLGRSLQRNVELARQVKLLDLPAGLLVSLDDSAQVPRNQLLVISTGAQAEVRSGLGLLAFRNNSPLALEPGDLVVMSSRAIPGNEPQVSGLVNTFLERGIEVLVPSQHPHLHTSGHAAQDEQAEMIDLVSPRHFVPIHGERRHLMAHAKLAMSRGVEQSDISILSDGDVVVSLGEGRVTRDPRRSLTRRLMRREGLVSTTPEALVERRYLAESGVVVVSLALDKTSNRALCKPVFQGKGLQADEVAAMTLSGASLMTEFDQLTSRARTNDDEVREAMIRGVRRTLKQLCGTKPTIIPVVVRV